MNCINKKVIETLISNNIGTNHEEFVFRCIKSIKFKYKKYMCVYQKGVYKKSLIMGDDNSMIDILYAINLSNSEDELSACYFVNSTDSVGWIKNLFLNSRKNKNAIERRVIKILEEQDSTINLGASFVDVNSIIKPVVCWGTNKKLVYMTRKSFSGKLLEIIVRLIDSETGYIKDHREGPGIANRMPDFDKLVIDKHKEFVGGLISL